MAIEPGFVLVVAYVLVSMGVAIIFLVAAFVIIRLIDWLRTRREERGEE
jgi:Flp pilus assembly protein TadB